MATIEPRLRTPDEIRRMAVRRWENGTLLRGFLRGEAQFPLVLPCRPPASGAIPGAFEAVRAWIRALREQSKERLGHGYTVEFERVKHRRLGSQALPVRVRFDTVEDLLGLIGKLDEFRRFCALVETIRGAQPALCGWLERHPGEVLQHEGDWPRLLAVVGYFQAHPRPGRYLRELEIPGVDSKFVEAHRALLRELLDAVLPPEAIDAAVTTLAGSGFEQRYGLRHDQPLIRFRLLDPSLLPAWPMRDVSVPLDEFAALDVPCRRIFVTENKVNGLAFPLTAESMVIFGLGYGVRSLVQARWLASRELHYWGDVDTHGFAILSQLRGELPGVRSFCMDRRTLLLHRGLWGTEDEGARYTAPLTHLGGEEQELYECLRADGLGRALRLEQERIAWEYVRERLREVTGGCG
ncbi:DUF3322 domain-containing protein [Sorangium sp. So ce1078]|uniref:DUF3322 domain-containing protein n=1 Tax=Sorangium sp. So ce1078 TaxID=3133329 RepID=UPI003F648BE8